MPMNPEFHVNFVPMKVWSDKADPNVDMPILTLENPNGLLFFVGALMHGSEFFPAGEEFTIVAYQGNEPVGYGTYSVHFNDVGDRSLQDDPEPVKLHVAFQSGVIVGLMQEVWKHVSEIVFAEEEEDGH